MTNTVARLAALALVLVPLGCDPVKVSPPTTATQTVPAPTPPPIEASVWGETAPQQSWQVRTLPDGAPGLFTAEGAPVVELLPELVVDVTPAGGRRVIPTTRRFELVKLTPGEEGGFTLFARLTDEYATHDLRVENGKHDPRIHVGIVSKWSRDALVHRVVARFRTGAFAAARAVGHDLRWTDVSEEWVAATHGPHIVTLGDDALTVEGRHGTEGLVVRRVEDGWGVEVEMLHHENHPVGAGDGCQAVLDGARPVAPAVRTEARADLIVGASRLPIVGRYPSGARAAVALLDESGARLGATDGALQVATSPEVWAGPRFSDLPCEGGRFTALARAGARSAWSGVSLGGDAVNVFAPTEADARRALALRQPGLPLETLFAVAENPADPVWFTGAQLTELRSAYGAIVAVAPGTVDGFLARDVSAERTVRDALVDAAREGDLWVAPVDELARHLLAAADVDLDFLPHGVVRVRNLGAADVNGLTLVLPEGMTARFNEGTNARSTERMVWFDLPAGGDVVLQVVTQADQAPAATMRPARIDVVPAP